MKMRTKVLVALFLLAFIVRVVFLFSTPIKIWDETVYANLGYDLSHNLLDYSVANNGWSDFIPSGGDSFYSWPKMGFRAPLLPYLLSVLYFFNLDFLINFFMIFVGALSVCLLYLLGEKLFNRRIAFYSAILFAVVPMHVIYSAKILTGTLFTFFVLLTFFSFWSGYEEGSKKHKVLFGVFLALALLSRYTALWIMPMFLIYFLIRDRSLKFLKDSYLWKSILAFFLVLIPWFIYGVSEYGNPIGAFIHGAKASDYWGGAQSWLFFFFHWWQMFSVIGFVFAVALVYIFYKKSFLKKEIYLLLIWFFFFLAMASYMPHKEQRIILAVVPALCMISGYFIVKIKNYRALILLAVVIIAVVSMAFQFGFTYRNSYTDANICFLEGNDFLKGQDNALIVTDESTVVYYYTRHETSFFPNPWSYESLENLQRDHYSDKNVFVFFSDMGMSLENEKFIGIKNDLDGNSEKVFECVKPYGYSAVYRM